MDADSKAAALRLIFEKLNKKTDIVQLDAADIAETIEFDPIYNHNSEFDVSTIIQDGFQESPLVFYTCIIVTITIIQHPHLIPYLYPHVFAHFRAFSY